MHPRGLRYKIVVKALISRQSPPALESPGFKGMSLGVLFPGAGIDEDKEDAALEEYDIEEEIRRFALREVANSALKMKV